MADQEEVATIEVAGREIMVRKLDDNVLMTLADIGRGQRAPQNDEERRRAANRLGRLGRIIESIMVNPEDHEWMHDELIERRLTMEEALDILKQTAKIFNQEEAPRTGPVKTVARRTRH